MRSDDVGENDQIRHTDVSPQRKAIYQTGVVLVVLGVCCCFCALAFSACSICFESHDSFDCGNLTNHPERVFIPVFIGGMVLCVVGSVLESVGKHGIAGSGVVLDPKRARRDLEPLNRMKGGMIKDMLDDANINLSGIVAKDAPCVTPVPTPEIKVRCRGCGCLNDEDAKFCKSCGTPL